MQFAAKGSAVAGPLKPFILPIGKLEHLVQTIRHSSTDFGDVFDKNELIKNKHFGSAKILSSGSFLA